ncbi:MAG TPA: NAD(P)/FAD-dependent oxidoreductase, partial [Pirellulales bacterium]
AFMARLERSGAKLALNDSVKEIEPGETGFQITTVDRVVVAKRVILTTGGKSYPGSGTTGDGYKLAARFGHTIVAPVPALVPIRVAAEWIKDLKGVTLPDVGVKVVQRPGTEPSENVASLGGKSSGGKQLTLAETRGSLLFAHFGLTGPAALDPSRVVARSKKPTDLDVVFDFFPEIKLDPLDEQLRERSVRDGKKQIASLLPEHLPQRLREQLIVLAGLSVETRAAVLSKGDRRKLATMLKGLATPVLGTLGFEKAEVTAGGVALDEVDSRTMESKLQPGFHLAGEVLDLDGPIGGYNFQAAFSTGWLAGQSV